MGIRCVFFSFLNFRCKIHFSWKGQEQNAFSLIIRDYLFTFVCCMDLLSGNKTCVFFRSFFKFQIGLGFYIFLLIVFVVCACVFFICGSVIRKWKLVFFFYLFLDFDLLILLLGYKEQCRIRIRYFSLRLGLFCVFLDLSIIQEIGIASFSRFGCRIVFLIVQRWYWDLIFFFDSLLLVLYVLVHLLFRI